MIPGPWTSRTRKPWGRTRRTWNQAGPYRPRILPAGEASGLESENGLDNKLVEKEYLPYDKAGLIRIAPRQKAGCPIHAE